MLAKSALRRSRSTRLIESTTTWCTPAASSPTVSGLKRISGARKRSAPSCASLRATLVPHTQTHLYGLSVGEDELLRARRVLPRRAVDVRDGRARVRVVHAHAGVVRPGDEGAAPACEIHGAVVRGRRRGGPGRGRGTRTRTRATDAQKCIVVVGRLGAVLLTASALSAAQWLKVLKLHSLDPHHHDL